MDLLNNPNERFDILAYLNNMYMAKITPTIDVQHAGGHHNRHEDVNDEDKEILQNNKKRINIPDAEIKHFSYQQQGSDAEYYESETENENQTIKRDGTTSNETSDKNKQTGGFGQSITEEVIQL